MKGTTMICVMAAGAVIGSCAVAKMYSCTATAKGRRKLKRYKNHMFKNMGTVLDAVSDFKH